MYLQTAMSQCVYVVKFSLQHIVDKAGTVVFIKEMASHFDVFEQLDLEYSAMCNTVYSTV